MIKQPKALYLLNFISMWECFSYYGMRALLILFMTQELRLGDQEAFGLYALYITLVEFCGVIGGVVADRFLGLKRAITWGGWTIALGHLLLTYPDSEFTFFIGLGLIVAGTSFFRTNTAAFLGKFYSENDPRRDAGYTIYYTGINIGGFLASIFCGFVGEVYGWHAGFGLAALGMLAGNIALWVGGRLLTDSAQATTCVENNHRGNLISALMLSLLVPLCALALYNHATVNLYFPIVMVLVIYTVNNTMKSCSLAEKKGLQQLCVYVCLLILFYACEEQLGSTLVLFSERHVDRETLFGMIPAASLITFNPLTMLTVGPLLSRWIIKIPMTPFGKIGISFSLLGTAFIVLWIGCHIANEKGDIPLASAIFSIILIAVGEILIGPTVFAAASKAAPKNHVGLTMSMVTLGFSFANLLSGWISQTMAVTDAATSLNTYKNGFYIIGTISIVLAVGIVVLNRKTKALA